MATTVCHTQTIVKIIFTGAVACFIFFGIYMVYGVHVLGIYLIHTNFRIYTDFESITSSNRVPEEWIHINASKNMKGTPQRQEVVSIYFKHLFFAVYTRYIPSIYLSWCLNWTHSGLLCLQASLGSLRPGRLANPLRFGHAICLGHIYIPQQAHC